MSQISRIFLNTLRCFPRTTRKRVSASSSINAIRSLADQAPAFQPHTKDDEPKQYDPKIVELVEYISKLNLREVSELNSLLKETLNISDAPIMTQAVAGAVAPVGGAEEEKAEDEFVPQSEFTVKLIGFEAANKIKIIKAIKLIKSDLNLVQVKKLVESCPQILTEGVSKEEGEALKKQLEEVGAKVEMV